MDTALPRTFSMLIWCSCFVLSSMGSLVYATPWFGVAVVPDASAPLVALGALVAIPGVVIEPVLDRRVARRLLAPGPG